MTKSFWLILRMVFFCKFVVASNNPKTFHFSRISEKSPTLPLTCNDAEYFTSDAWLLATHVYSPECEWERDGILRMEVYWSRDDTLAPKDGIKVSPSFNHVRRRGESPRDTPQIVRVRIPSAKPSWNENGSITGGTLDFSQFFFLITFVCLNETKLIFFRR